MYNICQLITISQMPSLLSSSKRILVEPYIATKTIHPIRRPHLPPIRLLSFTPLLQERVVQSKQLYQPYNQ
jgi:hypothetical protein